MLGPSASTQKMVLIAKNCRALSASTQCRQLYLTAGKKRMKIANKWLHERILQYNDTLNVLRS